ncbi:hypothetical protein [uncultured Fusobacterium sp.]|uniref:hypothetical protein n=1 Tax=uncultured Fusobacterium sp. TaxID=159267 RepID=UPI0025DAAB5E|nr:hypothetical protein [uncultured Fusobacterium sp.]
MKKSNPAEMLKNRFNLIAEKEANKKKELLNQTALIDYKEEDIPLLNIINEISDDVKVQELLRKSSIKFLNTISNSTLELGKLFEEVAGELKKQGSPDGIYIKWLESINMNRMTALRYRRRYRLFQGMKDISGQKTVSLLSSRVIDLIFKENVEETAIELLNDGATEKDIKVLLENKVVTLPIQIETKLEIVEITEKVNFIYNEFNKKVNELSEEEKIQVNNLLSKIEKIFTNKR